VQGLNDKKNEYKNWHHNINFSDECLPWTTAFAGQSAIKRVAYNNNNNTTTTSV
jgi:hypothetical protein